MHHSISRRRWLSGLAGLAALGYSASAARAQYLPDNHPALEFTRKATTALFNAHRLGTVQAFLPVIERNADVAYIADYSLGQYLKKMPDSLKPAYYRGVALFMSRYFADQTRSYRVAKWVVGKATEGSNGSFEVNSTVTLLSGTSYNVAWTVRQSDDGWKFIDAKVMIFSLTYAQRGLFTSYLQKHQGDVNQLVTVLNRK